MCLGPAFEELLNALRVRNYVDFGNFVVCHYEAQYGHGSSVGKV